MNFSVTSMLAPEPSSLLQAVFGGPPRPVLPMLPRLWRACVTCGNSRILRNGCSE